MARPGPEPRVSRLPCEHSATELPSRTLHIEGKRRPKRKKQTVTIILFSYCRRKNHESSASSVPSGIHSNCGCYAQTSDECPEKFSLFCKRENGKHLSRNKKLERRLERMLRSERLVAKIILVILQHFSRCYCKCFGIFLFLRLFGIGFGILSWFSLNNPFNYFVSLA